MSETAKPPKSVRQALRRYEDEAKQWRKFQDGAGQWWIRNDAQHVNSDMTVKHDSLHLASSFRVLRVGKESLAADRLIHSIAMEASFAPQPSVKSQVSHD